MHANSTYEKSFDIESTEDEFERPFEYVFELEEDVIYFKLKCKVISFKREKIGEDYCLSFNLKDDGVIYFNKTTNESAYNFTCLKNMKINELSIGNIYLFMEKRLEKEQEVTRDKIYDFLNRQKIKQPLSLLNILKAVNLYPEELEKLLIPEYKSLLLQLISSKDFSLSKGNKISQVVSIPKNIIKKIEELNLKNSLEEIRNICSEFDGNTMNIIIDLIENFKEFELNTNQTGYYSADKNLFIKAIYNLLKLNYKVTPLLNYLIKQSYYYSDNSSINYRIDFKLPVEEARSLYDYINMCNQNNMPYMKFPQNLKRTHGITVLNFKYLNDDSKNSDFIKAIKENYYHDPVEIKDYVFIVPKDIKDLIIEGNKLNHCIASFVPSIISNESNIYFMRKKDSINESLVTIELDPKTNNLVEFKEINNKVPEDKEILKAIEIFEKKMVEEKNGNKSIH